MTAPADAVGPRVAKRCDCEVGMCTHRKDCRQLSASPPRSEGVRASEVRSGDAVTEWQEARKAFLAVDHASPKDFDARKPLFDRLADAEGALMKLDARASAQDAVWSASTHDEIIKRLMAGVGMPNSTSLYVAFKQFANELHALSVPSAECK